MQMQQGYPTLELREHEGRVNKLDSVEYLRNRSPYKEMERAQKITERNCLCCERKFQSVGIHNRLCYYCRNQKFIDMTDESRIVNR
jgi:hypothetical protein